MANIHFDTISYMECHATATHVGDAIELRGLRDVALDTKKKGKDLQACALGSVKVVNGTYVYICARTCVYTQGSACMHTRRYGHI